MAKKSKVEARLRKKDNKSLTLNPFEIRHKKTKHKVVGVKEKTIGGLPGISRSRANEKRKKTLGLEYKKRMKNNKFLDERFGANDANLTPEEKMMQRFAIERQKRHSKQAAFDLEEDELTHNGMAIDQLDTFDDVYNSDNYDGDGDDNTTDLHFGGFLTKNEGQQTHERSGKDILDDIVAKSKLEKLEKQRNRDEANEATLKLDEDWTSLQPLLIDKIKAIKGKKNDDGSYDKAVRELAFETKAAPTDRLKTDEEIARENREELERLEKGRQERMQDGGAERQEKSADALLTVKNKTKKEKVMISYDKESGKMNKNKEFSSALEALKTKNSNKSDSEGEVSDSEDEMEGSDYDSEEEEIECSGEEKESGDEEATDVTKEDEKHSDDRTIELPKLASNSIEDDNNCFFGDVIADSDEDDINIELEPSTKRKNDKIPFILDAPEHLKDFNSLVTDLDEEDVIIIIKRIIASNHPTLQEENKEKSITFYIILIRYLTTQYVNKKLTAKLLDSILTQLFSITKFISAQIYSHMFGIVNNLKHLIQKNRGKSLSMIFSERYLIYLYLVERIYPVTDFKHAVVTPMLLSVALTLSTSSVRNLSDVKVGLFLCNFILNCTKTSHRYSPELIYFFTQIVRRVSGQKQEYVTNFKIKTKTLVPEEFTKPRKLEMNGLYNKETNNAYDVLYALLQTISSAMKQYHDSTSFHAAFYDLNTALSQVNMDRSFKDINEILFSLLQQYRQFSGKILPYLRYDNIKPTSIKLYEPKFDMVFMERRRKEKDETQRLKKKVKSELKGAVSEIRKDNKFMSRIKHKEQAAKDAARKRKVNEIMGFLSKEQGEANDLKWKKKRGKA